MKRPSTIAFALALLVLFHSTSLYAQTDTVPSWSIGVAKKSITPLTPMPMAGYSSRGAAHATGKLTELWAKALVMRDAKGHEGVLVTLDLVGIDRQLSQRICEGIEQKHGLKREQIVLSCSHTHCGPVISGNLATMHYRVFGDADRTLVDQYADHLVQCVLQVVEAAHHCLAPAEVGWAFDRETFAVNRRNNPEKEVPQRRSAGTLVGPVDHDVPILIARRDQRPVAIVFGYACHCTTLSEMQWSGDYAGHAQMELEAKYPEAVALFWAGCGADQNPIPRREVALAETYGKRLAAAVVRGMEGVVQPVEAELKTNYQEIELELDTLPTKEQLTADTKSNNVFIANRAKMLLEQIEAGKPLSQVYPYPIGYWQLGRQVDWVSLGGEVVVDYAIECKLRLSAQHQRSPQSVWVMGYAHDVMAYIPSRRVLAEGGYEGGGAMVYYGLPAPWAPSVERLIQSSYGRP